MNYKKTLPYVASAIMLFTPNKQAGAQKSTTLEDYNKSYTRALLELPRSLNLSTSNLMLDLNNSLTLGGNYDQKLNLGLDMKAYRYMGTSKDSTENRTNDAETTYTLADFDLSDYTFSAEDLENIFSCSENDKMLNVARKKAKKSRKRCYRGVKNVLLQCDIPLYDMQDQGHAYMAAKSLQSHPYFVKIECDLENTPKLPDGAIIVRGKNRQKKSGHIGIKDGNYDLSDGKINFIVGLGRYSNAEAFILKSMVIGQPVAEKLIQEGRLTTQAKIRIAQATFLKNRSIQLLSVSKTKNDTLHIKRNLPVVLADRKAKNKNLLKQFKNSQFAIRKTQRESQEAKEHM